MRGVRAIAAARHLALFIAIVAAAFPLVLNLFVQLDVERLLWVIDQPGRCAFFGGKFLLLVAPQSWLVAFGAFAAFLLMRRGQPFPSGAALAGGAVVALGTVLVISQPQLVATLIGCGR